MKIVHVNSSTSGGAYRAAVGLHKGLKNISVDSTFFTQGTSKETQVVQFQRKRENKAVSLWSKLRYKWIIYKRSRYRYERFGKPSYFEDPTVIWGPNARAEFPQADIYHLHDLKQFLDYQTFFWRLFPKKPMVWTLHDMNPFTGGCDYDYGCGRFQVRCGKCPALSSMVEQDISHENLQIKIGLFAKLDPTLLRIVTPSKWLSSEAKSSKVFGRFNVSTIPYGIDMEEFSPRDKNGVREALGMTSEEFVMLVLSTNLDDYRKGIHLLEKTLLGLEPKAKFTLLCAGQGAGLRVPGLRSVNAGSISNDRMLSLIYSAADVLVLPSLADNLPNVAIESLACGTPVVAFDTGGIPDIVEHEKTGLLVKTGDVEQFREHLSWLSNQRNVLRTMSDHCRATALKKFSTNRQAEAYLAIYRQLTQREQPMTAVNEQPTSS